MAKIEAHWDMDLNDEPILVIEKEEGELTLEEVKEFLVNAASGSFQGNYVLYMRAGEEKRDDGNSDDQWILRRVENGGVCPVCGSPLDD